MKGIITRLNKITNEIDIKEYMLVMRGKAYKEFEHAGPPPNYPCRSITFRGIKTYVDFAINENDIVLYKVVKRSKNELE